MKSRTIAALLALATAAALAATAGFAAVSAAPDPAQMALLAADIPDSKVKGKRLKPDKGYVAAYAREFELSKPYGSSQLLFISSEVALAATAKTPIADMANFRKFLRSTQGRQFLANSHRRGARHDRRQEERDDRQASDTADRRRGGAGVAGRPHQGGALLCRHLMVPRRPHALDPRGRRPPPRRPRLGQESWAGLIVAHVGQQFTPVSTLPPTITGTPVQGQTLTTSTGTFSMTPTYTYAWQRCDAAGAACADIVGATTPTYVVTPEDVAATLRVTVTATNRFGAATGQSLQTAVVT